MTDHRPSNQEDHVTTDPLVKKLRRALRRAVSPHAFNCGYKKDTKNIKMIELGYCTCGVTELLNPRKSK